MKKIGKIYLYTTTVILLAWLIPWSYAICTAEAKSTPFTLYSCIINDFASLKVNDEGEIIYFDRKGNKYNDAQFDSILPMFYYRQLLSEGRMPDSINGTEINIDVIQNHNFNIRISPTDFNKTTPELYLMLESMPKRVDLEEPSEAFRSTEKGIEFIEMETNKVNLKRSQEFTETMKRKGFDFPIKRIHGNPTTMKSYDEGYIVSDSKGSLYHIKQICGKPFVRYISLPESVEVEQLMITEFPDRSTLAYIFTTDNHIAIVRKDYNVYKTGIKYNPYNQGLIIIGDLFDYTVKVSDTDKEHYYALNASTYTIKDEMINSYKDSSLNISDFLFPFKLTFTSYNDKWVYPRINIGSEKAIPLGILLSLIFFFSAKRKDSETIIKMSFILILGIYFFIPLLLIKK